MASIGARNVSIQLTQQEEELFSILLKTLEHQRLNTVLRCAGGWVRDKLLGKQSHDIDIAIDNKLGAEFAEHVNNYLSSQDLETRRVRCTAPRCCCCIIPGVWETCQWLQPISILVHPMKLKDVHPLMDLLLQIAVIVSNPEQSKHLETARMKVAGLELDLVNLRSEKYADQTSRIPTMEFGSPEEDALRCPMLRFDTIAGQ